MVIANPIAFWKASALPTLSCGQARAERAEKCGESATTLAPHSSISPASASGGQAVAKGYNAQHSADTASATAATRALPMRRLSQPPSTQPTAPMPITAKAGPEGAPASPPRAALTSSGTSVQKAYNSH